MKRLSWTLVPGSVLVAPARGAIVGEVVGADAGAGAAAGAAAEEPSENRPS